MQAIRPSNFDSKRTRLIFGAILFGTTAWTLGAEPGTGAHAAASLGGHTAAPSVSAAPSRGQPSPAGNARSSSNTGESAQHASRGNEGHHENRDRHGGGYIYYNPWWDSYGWDTGSYGDGFSNGYNLGAGDDSDFTNTSNANNDNAVQAPQQSDSPAAAEVQLDNAIDRSPAMVSANNQVQLAQAEYDKDRERVLASLANTPEYKEAMSHRHQAATDLRAAKSSSTTAPTVLDAATEKLDAADEVTKMQEQAIATDPAATDAKARLAQAVADRDPLRANMLAKH